MYDVQTVQVGDTYKVEEKTYKVVDIDDKNGEKTVISEPVTT